MLKSGKRGSTDKKDSMNYSLLRELIAMVVIVALFSIIFGRQGGDSSLSFSSEGDSIELSYEDCSVSIEMAEIADIQIVDSFDFGTRVDAEETVNYWYGEYRNDEIGDYILCVSTKTDIYIVIEMNDGTYYVVNWTSESDTEALYEGVVEFMEGG